MKTSVHLLMILTLIPVILGAQEPRFTETPLGRLVRVELPSAPFPHVQRANGHTYGERFFPADEHYRDSTVAIFIPAGISPDSSVDMVFHFHGWYNNVDSVLSQFRLMEQFTRSRKNAILIVPQGPKNAPDSFGGRLEETGAFRELVKDVLRTLEKALARPSLSPGSIVLSGHSGAYRVISFILLRGGLADHIGGVFLFDALYGQTEKFAHWIDHSSGKLTLIYTTDGGTRSETENFKEDLLAWKVPLFTSSDRDVTEKDLRENRIVFLTTDMSHNEVMSRRDTFLAFLKASGLKDVP